MEEPPRLYLNDARALTGILVPHCAKDTKIAYRMVNAKSETLAVKPSFRTAYPEGRRLILANGFFELQKEDKGKIPMYIFLKSDEHFAFAGLWESWKAPAGVTILSCTIITTEPNSFMVPIHNRMPVYCLRSQRRCGWTLRLKTPHFRGRSSYHYLPSR